MLQTLHCVNAIHRELRIDVMKRRANRGGHVHRISGGPHHHLVTKPMQRILGNAEINLILYGVIEPVFIRVAGNTDDPGPAFTLVETEPPANRIFTGPAMAGHGLVYQGGQGSFTVVVIVEGSSLQNGLPEGLEILRGHLYNVNWRGRLALG